MFSISNQRVRSARDNLSEFIATMGLLAAIAVYVIMNIR
jgi:hypothetical protein